VIINFARHETSLLQRKKKKGRRRAPEKGREREREERRSGIQALSVVRGVFAKERERELNSIFFFPFCQIREKRGESAGWERKEEVSLTNAQHRK
jgi:hypothetical protein